MVARALIVAIEEYPDAGGFAARLEGTRAAGDRFRAWFVDKKHGGKEPGPAFLRHCAAEGHPGRTSGTTRNEILDEMDALVRVGKDETSELYVFFSGHGVAFEERRGRPRVDVLLTSDFADLRRGGRASVPLADLQEKVQAALGPGEHYYFIDACRNVVGPRDLQPLPVDNVWEPSLLGIACVLTLHSTRSGARAHVRSGFADTLVAGLSGRGKAKLRADAQRMVVTFDQLARYVRSRMPPDQQPVPTNDQACDGVIQEIAPIPRSRCVVSARGAAPDEDLVLVVSDPFGDFPDRSIAFRGNRYELLLSPNDYGIRLLDAAGQESFRREDPPANAPVDVWEDREVVFVRERAPAGLEKSLPLPAQLRLVAPPGTHLSLSRSGAGKVLDEAVTSTSAYTALGAGDYHLEITERGSLVASREIKLRPGEEQEHELRSDAQGSVRDALLRATGNDPQASRVEVSESLGPFANARMGLLLSLVGASRIVEPHFHFEKLGHLPLETFVGSAPGTSAVYVLAAFEPGQDDADPMRVDLHRGDEAYLRPAVPVYGIPGMWERRIDTEPGPRLLSFAAPGRLPITIATHALANRATLVTLSDGDEPGDVEIHQYLLPIYGCRGSLHWKELEHLERSAPLRFVRLLWHAQNLFALKRKLDFNDEDRHTWDAFSLGKWVDPMMGILAGYELARRGRREGNDRYILEAIAENLDRFFGDIPDTRVIRKLVTGRWAPSGPPAAPPLVRHGMLLWSPEDGPPPAPLPREKLLISGMWTAWLDAVP